MKTRKCDKCKQTIPIHYLCWGFEEQGDHLRFVKTCEICAQKSVLERAWLPKKPARKLKTLEYIRFLIGSRMLTNDLNDLWKARAKEKLSP
jgi:hypothetical protein